MTTCNKGSQADMEVAKARSRIFGVGRSLPLCSCKTAPTPQNGGREQDVVATMRRHTGMQLWAHAHVHLHFSRALVSSSPSLPAVPAWGSPLCPPCGAGVGCRDQRNSTGSGHEHCRQKSKGHSLPLPSMQQKQHGAAPEQLREGLRALSWDASQDGACKTTGRPGSLPPPCAHLCRMAMRFRVVATQYTSSFSRQPGD